MKNSDAELDEFYVAVDARAEALAERHAGRLQCRRGCASCCIDDLTVLEVEAERIRRNHAELLRDAQPHPPGACAFLDAESSCRIYADRPYVCRTQGLPLRWFEAAVEPSGEGAAQVIERRDICPLNLEGPALERLPDDDCWLLGPAEDQLREIQARHDPGVDTRVMLRSLFRDQRAS